MNDNFIRTAKTFKNNGVISKAAETFSGTSIIRRLKNVGAIVHKKTLIKINN